MQCRLLLREFLSAFTQPSDTLSTSSISKQEQIMAQKATIYKVELSVSDMDRHYYETHKLTVAKHPSETDERLNGAPYCLCTECP